MSLLILFLAILNLNFLNAQDEYPVVNVTGGAIRGKLLNTTVEPFTLYYSFKNVPYAAPPIGNLRFQDPQSVQGWEGIRDAEFYGSSCLQKLNQTHISGSEDCLTLNVHTKQLEVLVPVMVWIHGGGFTGGQAAGHNPDYFLRHDVVIVTINYRLGVFGYLSLNDPSAYGNAGLKDQVAALRWVQDNIERFGGDPAKVTVFGESAGAYSVELIQLSPLASGLFRNTISLSGCALSPRVLQKEPAVYGYRLAAYFGIPVDFAPAVVNGLQGIDASELLLASQDPAVTGYIEPLKPAPFIPVLEIAHPGAFLSNSSYQILEEGTYSPVPFMMGFNTADGSLGVDIVNGNYNIDDFDSNVTLFLSQSLNNPSDSNAGQVIRDFFLGNSSARDTEFFLRFWTQEFFARATRKTVDFKRIRANGYLYRFSYKGTYTSTYPGVGHGEETQYYWNYGFDQNTLTAQDKLTIERMTKLLVNFAILGNPTPVEDSIFGNVTWPAVTSQSVGFLDIGAELVPGTYPNETEYLFFQNVFNNFGVPPYYTF